MKITAATANNRKHAFEVTTERGTLLLPYAKADPAPSASDVIVSITIDEECACEVLSYRLASGAEGWLHVEQFFDYNQEPTYMRDLMLYKLTLEAEKRLKESRLSKREIIRRLRTSPAQFYRLLDATNYTKSIDQMLALLYVLDCEVDLVVRGKSARKPTNLAPRTDSSGRGDRLRVG